MPKPILSRLPACLMLAGACMLAARHAAAQSAPNLKALQGLAPFATLLEGPGGKAALAANLAVTAAIQSGASDAPTLLPFAAQQQQALRDAFITSGNASQLADGLGSRLGAVYQARAHYDDAKHFSSVSPALERLFAYANETTASDSNMAKYAFANGTIDGKTPVSDEAAAIRVRTKGQTDIFGKAYNRPAGSMGAGLYGNARPFQTEPSLTPIGGVDFFDRPTTNDAYLRGPLSNLGDSPAFPSGHTTYGTMEAVLLGILVPDRYAQEIVRAAEYGNDRIILGAHYAMDVVGGRTLALHDVAHLLANDPVYVGTPRNHAAVVADFRAALQAARADMTAALQEGCGTTVALCAKADTSRFARSDANEAFIRATQTYGLPIVHPETAASVEDVKVVAPEAGYLLTAAFPALSLDQADDILMQTEGPGGGFLDDGSNFGIYSRLNLYAAAIVAARSVPRP